MSESRDPIGMLLRSADSPIEPDAARMERAMGVVHGEWQAMLQSRRRTRRGWFAAAACVILALLAGLILAFRPAAPAVTAATAVRVQGDVLVDAQPLMAGQTVTSRQRIDTGRSGRVLLDVASGGRVRVDSGSLARWVSLTELRLARGRVYVETSERRDEQVAQLIVSTPFGIVRHVGTRFEVQISSDQTRVRVRDGAVDFERESKPPIRVATGQQLTVNASDAVLAAGPESADAQWSWTREISPALIIEGHPLADALDWLSRETGLEIVYQDEQARTQAHALILRGNVDGLSTRDALRAVLAGSGLSFQISGDRVDIRSGRADSGRE
jgi:ferric-dicitrate binding protein FerR (iron transport regulator)